MKAGILTLLVFLAFTAVAQKRYPPKRIKMSQGFGVNAFEWDFEDAKNPLVINEQQLSAMKSFTAIRHYMDWERLESVEGSYTFNPTASGGWNYDVLYQRCKKEGIEVLACLKTMPPWMLATWPTDQRDAENVPVKYGKSFSDPDSYVEQAKVAFQFVARYGSNAKVDPRLLSVNEQPRWADDMVNKVQIGLNLVKYIECDNERDKWWKGPKAFSSGKDFAANLSAFYDGNKNTMGPGVGVKNADPNIQVVMGGLAKPDVGYLKEMIEWCRIYRGYHKDGSINLCWDVINYHYYTGDDSSPTGGEYSRGKAPERSNANRIAKEFVAVSQQFAGNMPVWITETGYDINQGSPLKAIGIGSKSAEQTQADWILRTILLHLRNGVDRVFLYQTYDYNPKLAGKFSSSGLLNVNMTRKPAADYLVQVNRLMGNYEFDKILSDSSSPVIAESYRLGAKKIYILTKPTEDGSSVWYDLSLPGVKRAMIYKPLVGSEVMSNKTVSVTNGKLAISVSETPTFLLPIEEK
jgi:endoglucanase